MLGGEVDLIDSVMFLVFLLALIVGFSLIHFLKIFWKELSTMGSTGKLSKSKKRRNWNEKNVVKGIKSGFGKIAERRGSYGENRNFG